MSSCEVEQLKFAKSATTDPTVSRPSLPKEQVLMLTLMAASVSCHVCRWAGAGCRKMGPPAQSR